jgi:hypothetical protein
MTLRIISLQSHDDESSLAYTVTFDDSESGRRMMATVSEAAFFEPAAHPDCEAIDVEPKARGKLCSVKYHTEDVIRTIKRYIRDEVNRENAE